MRVDIYGQKIYTENDLCDLYLTNPDRTIKQVLTDTPIVFSEALELTNHPKSIRYINPKLTMAEFDRQEQSNWLMPASYKDFDIAAYVLSLCSSPAELQRAGQELVLFQERGMFPLLAYLKYLVDTMRKHNVVWGVGRGSSVASFVLFLIGVHRINSLFYDLSIDEFLK